MQWFRIESNVVTYPFEREHDVPEVKVADGHPYEVKDAVYILVCMATQQKTDAHLVKNAATLKQRKPRNNSTALVVAAQC